jgi:predicted nucleic acid-binding protein
VILVDSNVPMYLIGAPHPHKTDAQRRLETLLSGGERLVTDAEAFQEILHRFAAIDRRDAIGPAFEVLSSIVDEVLPVTESDVLRARDVLLAATGLSARDALHVAVMEHAGVDTILSFDRGFDQVPGIRRLGAL